MQNQKPGNGEQSEPPFVLFDLGIAITDHGTGEAQEAAVPQEEDVGDLAFKPLERAKVSMPSQ